MKSPAKAVMLSALGFPGAGQFYLGLRVTATVMLVVYLVSLITVLMPVMSASVGLAEQIESGELQINADLLATLSSSVSDTMASASTATFFLVGTWVVSVAHAWYYSRHQAPQSSP